jgi:hypothetical protein
VDALALFGPVLLASLWIIFGLSLGVVIGFVAAFLILKSAVPRWR